MSLDVHCGAGHDWDVTRYDRCPQCPRGAPELDVPPRSWQWAPPLPVLGRCALCGRPCPLDRRCTHGAGTPPAYRWVDSETLAPTVPAAVPTDVPAVVEEPSELASAPGRRRLVTRVSPPLRSRRARPAVTRDQTVPDAREQHEPRWEEMNRQELRRACQERGLSQRGTVTDLRARLAGTPVTGAVTGGT